MHINGVKGTLLLISSHFDVVVFSQNNIEIENVEEANFLKEKLCNLLKEFQAKKSEKTAVGVNCFIQRVQHYLRHAS